MADSVVYADLPETILREQPSASSKAVNHVLLGTKLTVVEQSGNFLKVTTMREGGGGWVHKDDVRPTPILKIFYVDVGQGDGAIVEHPKGIMLIDGGPSDGMYRFMLHRYSSLFDNGAKVHIDAVVMSHPDLDHYAGLTPILKDPRFTFGTIFHNGIVRYGEDHPDVAFDLGATATRTIGGQQIKVLTETISTLSQAQALLARSDANPIQDPKLVMATYAAFWKAALDAKQQSRLGSAKRVTSRDKTLPGFGGTSPDLLRIEVLGPVPTKTTGAFEFVGFAEPAEHGETPSNSPSSSHTCNGHSVVLKLIYGQHSFLFGGDLNIPAERHLLAHYGTQNPFRCDVAKACHHGSSDFTVAFLKKVSPQVNVFSSGDNKSFDHPVADALGAAGRHASGDFPLLFSTELARATTSHGIHFGLINARSNGTLLAMAQMKEQHNKADVWDSFTVPWKGKFADS